MKQIIFGFALLFTAQIAAMVQLTLDFYSTFAAMIFAAIGLILIWEGLSSSEFKIAVKKLTTKPKISDDEETSLEIEKKKETLR